MKKLLGLLGMCGIFTFATCGGIEFNFGKNAEAESIDCANGGGPNGTGGVGGEGKFANPECGSHDGTRLKRLYLEGDDGTRAESGQFLDTKLDVNCSFQLLPNGETRCVPEHGEMDTYSDPECKIPIYLVWNRGDSCNKVHKYVRFDERPFDANACETTPTKFRIYSANTSDPIAPSSWFTLRPNGDCRSTTLFPQAGDEIVAAYSARLLGTQEDFVHGKLP